MKMTNLIFCAILYLAMPDVAKAQTTIGNLPPINADSCYGADVLILEHGTGPNATDVKLSITQLVDSLLPPFNGSDFVDFTGGLSVSGAALTVGSNLIANDSALLHGIVVSTDTGIFSHLRLPVLATHSASSVDSAATRVDSTGNVTTGCYFSCADTSNGNLASRHFVDSISSVIPSIYHVRDSVSSAQILTSYSAPVVLVAAPPSGYFIHIIGLAGVYIYSGAAYSSSNITGIFMGDTLHYNVQVQITHTYSQWINNLVMDGVQQSSFANQAIEFYTQTANPSISGGAGYFIFYVDYIFEKY